MKKKGARKQHLLVGRMPEGAARLFRLSDWKRAMLQDLR